MFNIGKINNQDVNLKKRKNENEDDLIFGGNIDDYEEEEEIDNSNEIRKEVIRVLEELIQIYKERHSID